MVHHSGGYSHSSDEKMSTVNSFIVEGMPNIRQQTLTQLHEQNNLQDGLQMLDYVVLFCMSYCQHAPIICVPKSPLNLPCNKLSSRIVYFSKWTIIEKVSENANGHTAMLNV